MKGNIARSKIYKCGDRELWYAWVPVRVALPIKDGFTRSRWVWRENVIREFHCIGNGDWWFTYEEVDENENLEN